MEPQLQRPADYRVLARAYRPTRLSALIGQEALVRTLKNAFASGRVAHAFLLSGIRGVGKTTTARIIARGLNCTGPDGQGGPTPEPCGVCPSCTAIDEDRALDVIEMDAASQTGKDDVLELLEGLQFLPSYSRYKVYILDEVHMLSPKAWNALLKTVEEPPPHAKFIFATTEVRKVPITVLSRCQKFELRRVEPEELAAHLAGICAKEGVAVAPDALAMIARAAEGSVRDALSLLDQAIATAEGPVDGELVQSMLGLGDRLQLLDLFDTVMRGDARRRAGAVRPSSTRWAPTRWPWRRTCSRSATGCRGSRWRPRRPPAWASPPPPPSVLRAMAKELSLPVLARAWQMLLRGIDEIRVAPDAAAAAEMLLLRLACVSDLPSPAELARLLRGGDGAEPVALPARPAPSPAPTPGAVAAGRRRGPADRSAASGGAAARRGGAERRARRLRRVRRPAARRRRGAACGLAVAERPSDPLRARPRGAALRRRGADRCRRPRRRGGDRGCSGGAGW